MGFRAAARWVGSGFRVWGSEPLGSCEAYRRIMGRFVAGMVATLQGPSRGFEYSIATSRWPSPVY